MTDFHQATIAFPPTAARVAKLLYILNVCGGSGIKDHLAEDRMALKKLVNENAKLQGIIALFEGLGLGAPETFGLDEARRIYAGLAQVTLEQLEKEFGEVATQAAEIVRVQNIAGAGRG